MDKTTILSRYFADHEAAVVLCNRDFLILDWKNRNGSSEYAIRYILDKARGELHITGDWGYAIASWYNRVEAEQLADYLNDTGYFASKLQCTTDLYTYRWKDVLEDLEQFRKEYLAGKGIPETGEEAREVRKKLEEIRDMLDDMDYAGQPYTDEVLEKIRSLDPDALYGIFGRLGRRLNERIAIWAAGYQMAYKQVYVIAKYQNHAPIEIPVDADTVLTAEGSSDPDYKEIMVGLQKRTSDGSSKVWVQDLAIVRTEPEYETRKDKYEVLVYGKAQDENWTNQFFVEEYDFDEELAKAK